MPILKINSNSSFFDILSEIPSGIDRDFLIDADNTSRLGQMIIFASKLIEVNIKPYLEVKFKSKFGKREKRIEIVTKNGKDITLFKITTYSKYDKDAIDLSGIISEIQEQIDSFNICGVLLFLDNTTDIEFVNKTLITISKNIVGRLFEHGISY